MERSESCPKQVLEVELTKKEIFAGNEKQGSAGE